MKPSLHTLSLIAAALALALVADAWRTSRQDASQLAALLAAQNTVIQQAAGREQQRDGELATALAGIANQKRAIQTPAQAAAAIPSLLPNLPLPISIRLPEISRGNGKSASENREPVGLGATPSTSNGDPSDPLSSPLDRRTNPPSELPTNSLIINERGESQSNRFTGILRGIQANIFSTSFSKNRLSATGTVNPSATTTDASAAEPTLTAPGTGKSTIPARNANSPAIIQVPPLSKPTQTTDSVTLVPATITIPQSDLKPLYDDLQDCRSTALTAESLKKDLADEKTQSAALIKERNAAQTAAQGGSTWLRLKRESKWFVIGIATGAAAAALARH